MVRIILAAFLAVATWTPVHANDGVGERKGVSPTPQQLSVGARLYVNWQAATFRAPITKRHPLWKGSPAVAPGETWRCVNCHGWDYRGTGGVGGDLGKIVGAPGLRHLAGRPVSEVTTALSFMGHDFRGEMPDLARVALARFVSAGQQEINDLIERYLEGGGQWQDGAWHFSTVCRVCHGRDGMQMHNDLAAKPISVGAIASTSPWRFLHAVRFGHQDGMPSFVLLSDQALLDTLRYASTRLPHIH